MVAYILGRDHGARAMEAAFNRGFTNAVLKASADVKASAEHRRN